MEKPDEGEQLDKQQRTDDLRRPPGSLRRQFIGALVGAAVALIVFTIGRQVGWLGGDMVQYLLWGGVIGGLIGGSDALAQAGRRLTHRDQDWINILVALIGMVIIFGALFAVAYALTQFVRGVFGR